MANINSNVELKIPVSEDYVSVVRLLVSGLCTRLGLDVNETENLKMVIGEAYLTIVSKCETAVGLIHLNWAQDANHISVSISDPSGKHKSVTNAANLALLSQLGGEYNSTTVDGVDHLNIDFDIKYKEERPFLFNERDSGQA